MDEGDEEIRMGSLAMGGDGVLRFVISDGIRSDEADIRELLEAMQRLGGGEPMLVLSDIRGLRSASASARAAAASPEATRLNRAAAIVVGSRATRMIGNFFLKLNRPAYPSRIFNSEDAALAWLLSFDEAPAEAG